MFLNKECECEYVIPYQIYQLLTWKEFMLHLLPFFYTQVLSVFDHLLGLVLKALRIKNYEVLKNHKAQEKEHLKVFRMKVCTTKSIFWKTWILCSMQILKHLGKMLQNKNCDVFGVPFARIPVLGVPDFAIPLFRVPVGLLVSLSQGPGLGILL